MTSKRLFFKAMREDLRHRGWMIALSVLGSFLVLPLIWLVISNNPNNFRDYTYDGLYAYRNVVDGFWRGINVFGGSFAIGGALVAGLAGFRFVFHKDQVDTWHSLPIKRNLLFWVYYVNGCVVWLLPLLVCTALTAALSAGLVRRKVGAEAAYEMVKFAAGDLALWLLIFFLVYHLVLVAMMLSGNVLNTIVSMLIMGVGSASLYGLVIMMCQLYFDTAYFFSIGKGVAALYASPLVSTVVLLVERVSKAADYSLTINLAIALLLGVLAWLLYRRRPSELAEQGIRSKLFSTALRLAVTIGTGLGGWMVFYVLTYSYILWSIFGAVLAAVLVFGVLDIVFQMDFRAFFAHKLQMAGAVAAVLLLCFAFYGDWFGYDTYLPRKEQIAELGIQAESLGNRNEHWVVPSLEIPASRDAESIYAFLEKMTKNDKGGTENVVVRVTLKNGRTYYRTYRINREALTAVLPMVSGEEYLKYTYCLNEGVAQDHELTLHPVRGTREKYEDRKYAKGELLELVRAYNRDVLEHSEDVLLGEGRLLTRINLNFQKPEGYNSNVYLEVYESMENTIEELKKLGYEELVTPMEAAEIAAVGLFADLYGSQRTAQDMVNAAWAKYGGNVAAWGGVGQTSVPSGFMGAEMAVSSEAMGAAVAGEYANPASQSPMGTSLTLYITEPEEIEELLPLLSYDTGFRRWGTFKREYVAVDIEDKNGEYVFCYIKKGDLPEKYILRFGELAQGETK